MERNKGSVSTQGDHPGPRSQWDRDSVEDLVDRLVGNYTKTTKLRMFGLIEAMFTLSDDNIEGDLVECGVWAGGNIILFRKILPTRMCWLYDTFQGMTEPGIFDRKRDHNGVTALDRYKARGGKWAEYPLNDVKANLYYMGALDTEFLRFVEGRVEDTLLEPKNLPKQIALLRLDTDWYDSTRIELEVLWPLVAPGGILIVDDYGYWLGARKAVDDYFGPKVDKVMLDDTACLIRKSF